MEVNFKKMSNVLVVGLTKEAAIKQADYLTEKYREYGIEADHNSIDENSRHFNNYEFMVTLSFSELKYIKDNFTIKFNGVYFDKEIPQDEFFELITPLLITPKSLWQFQVIKNKKGNLCTFEVKE